MKLPLEQKLERLFVSAELIQQRDLLDRQVVAAVDAMWMRLQTIQPRLRLVIQTLGELIELIQDAGIVQIEQECLLRATSKQHPRRHAD